MNSQVHGVIHGSFRSSETAWLTSLTRCGPVQVKAAGYAAFRGAPSRYELERFVFLDDADRELIEGKRRAHNRLGPVQMTTARFLGVVPDDPTDVPAEVVDYPASGSPASLGTSRRMKRKSRAPHVGFGNRVSVAGVPVRRVSE